jgi:hypothetical protein
MSIGEFFKVKGKNLRFQWETIRLYYGKSALFALADIALGFVWLFFNPYRIARKNGFIYGETPPSSLHRIASFCALSSKDCWLELGSGRGKGCFWVAQFIGCRAIGIEKVFLFYASAKLLGSIFFPRRLAFIHRDMADADFSKATFVYLYSTCMEEEELQLLAEKMKKLPHGAKVVSVSAPLPEVPHLKRAGSFPLSFPWGETEGYLHLLNLGNFGNEGS